MRLRTLLLTLLLLLPLAAPASAQISSQTPTEAQADAIARTDHTAYTLPPDALAKAVTLEHTRTALHFGEALWSILTLWLILEWRIAARMRNVAVNLSKNRWAQGFVFFFEFLLLTTLLGLPFDLYHHHIGLHYGLSVQGWGSWFGDQLKTFGLVYIFGGLLVMLLFWIIRKFPRRWWLGLWFPVMLLTVLGVFLQPTFARIFDRFEPLQNTNPALVTQLERVVARGKGIAIPPDRMFLMHASDKVTTLNAYVSGFGASKRVVVWDTSIQKGTPDEILFIFGHEMGHYVLGHIVSSVLFSFVVILVSFFLGFHFFKFLMRRYGDQWRVHSQDNWAALVVFVLVLSVIGFLTEPIDNTFSRMHEHAADVYGEEAVHGIVQAPQVTGQQAFDLLGANSFDDPDPNPFVVFWTYSHPSIAYRAAFARAYNPWAQGAQPAYFLK